MRAKLVYVEAFRDWVLKGAKSEHAFDAAASRAHLRRPNAGAAEAYLYFQLAQHLKLAGKEQEAVVQGRHP